MIAVRRDGVLGLHQLLRPIHPRARELSILLEAGLIEYRVMRGFASIHCASARNAGAPANVAATNKARTFIACQP
jgi:hypothetical protein